MRSVQAKLPLHGLESQMLISEAQNILEIKSQPIFCYLVISRKDALKHCALFSTWCNSLETLHTF